jgi:hypothetical protein
MPMMPPSPSKPVSFSDVAFKGAYKWAFIVLALVAAIGIVAGAAMVPVQPPGASGSSAHEDIAIEVPDYAEPPMKIHVSHSFRLVTTPYSGAYAVDDGWEEIPYNITIDDESGRQVAEDFSRLNAPEQHSFSKYDTEDTVTVANDHEFSLRPGKYIVTVASLHPVDYRIEQTSKYLAPGASLMGLGILCIVLLFGLVFLALRKRDSLRRSQMGGPAGAVHYAPAPYVPVPSAPMQYPTDFQGPAQPPEDPRRSSLEYVPGGLYAEVQCSYCGSSIRNPPVNGIITCDRCGQMGRLY